MASQCFVRSQPPQYFYKKADSPRDKAGYAGVWSSHASIVQDFYNSLYNSHTRSTRIILQNILYKPHTYPIQITDKIDTNATQIRQRQGQYQICRHAVQELGPIKRYKGYWYGYYPWSLTKFSPIFYNGADARILSRSKSYLANNGHQLMIMMMRRTEMTMLMRWWWRQGWKW